MTWEAPCVVCRVQVRESGGIYCRNFLRKRKQSQACLAVWCGKCFVPYPSDTFPIQKTQDKEEHLETEEQLQHRFRCGRNGDHLMGIPFECDLCHFRNLNGFDPSPRNPKDQYTLLVIRRALLDAFWSRERSTVIGNLSRLILDYRSGMSVLSIARCPLPVLRSNKVVDRVGMGPSLLMLHASRQAGKYTPSLKHDSTRRTLTWHNNAHAAGEKSSSSVILTNQEKSFHIIDAPHSSCWREWLVLGMKRRTDIFRKQDEPLFMTLLLAILDLAEEDWEKSKAEKERKLIKETMCFIILDFMLLLRGEEVPLTDLQCLISYWSSGKDATVPQLEKHIMVTLRGKFKGEDNERWHMLPLPDRSSSKVPTRRWMRRMLYRQLQAGRHRGPFFAKQSGKRASIGDYDSTFRGYLTRLRVLRGALFLQGVDIQDYSGQRSFCRGSVQHALNQDVSQPVIDEANRWRRKEGARGTNAGLPLRQVYTLVRYGLPTRAKYPGSL